MVLSAASRLAGLTFLPPGRDDQLLLAIDDAQVAVVVELADVAGVEPPVGQRLGRLVRARRGSRRRRCRPGRAPRRRRPARTSQPGIAGPTVPDLDRASASTSSGRCSRTCRRSPTAARRWPGTTRSSSGGIGAAPVMATSHWSSPIMLAHRARSRRRRGRPRWPSCSGGGPVPVDRLGDRHGRLRSPSSNCAALSGSAPSAALHAGVDLLPHPGHAEDDVGLHLAQVRADLDRVGTGGDLEADEGLLVVAGHALGDVGHRQVGHEPLAGQALERRSAGAGSRRSRRRWRG